MKILIVDDDFTSRRLLQKYLNHCGRLDSVVTGEEAIHAFVLAWKDEKPFDLICLDIMMPELNGQEALRRIREMEKEMGIRSVDEVKVIMVTSLDDPKNRVQAFNKGGATSYVFKPVNKEKLMAEVHRLGLEEPAKEDHKKYCKIGDHRIFNAGVLSVSANGFSAIRTR